MTMTAFVPGNIALSFLNNFPYVEIDGLIDYTARQFKCGDRFIVIASIVRKGQNWIHLLTPWGAMGWTISFNPGKRS